MHAFSRLLEHNSPLESETVLGTVPIRWSLCCFPDDWCERACPHELIRQAVSHRYPLPARASSRAPATNRRRSTTVSHAAEHSSPAMWCEASSPHMHKLDLSPDRFVRAHLLTLTAVPAQLYLQAMLCEAHTFLLSLQLNMVTSSHLLPEVCTCMISDPDSVIV